MARVHTFTEMLNKEKEIYSNTIDNSCHTSPFFNNELSFISNNQFPKCQVLPTFPFHFEWTTSQQIQLF
jgi:hypothetical protein